MYACMLSTHDSVFQQMAQNITIPRNGFDPSGENVSTYQYYDKLWRLVKRTYPAAVAPLPPPTRMHVVSSVAQQLRSLEETEPLAT